MILVDTSVWIGHLNDTVTGRVSRLRELIPSIPLLVGDLILCEVLQGLRSEREAHLVERGLRRFETVSLLDPDLAVKAAANYRFLRSRGSTIRNSIVMGSDFYEVEMAQRAGDPGVGIGRNCVIERAIIDKNARIGDGAVLDGAVVGSGAEIGGGNELLRGVRVWPGVRLDGTAIRFSTDA